jgi:catechol 2,3-dioxygenase-like lactoylglutathione lyase family enzyme
MRVLGYTWAGVRTADLKSSARFFGDVLGLSLIHEGTGMIQFEVPSWQMFEVFGPESRY